MSASSHIRRVADHYSKKAAVLGYSARSVFKLEEIQKKFKVLGNKQTVVDLGCNPGSWSQYCVDKYSSNVVGIDLTSSMNNLTRYF